MLTFNTVFLFKSAVTKIDRAIADYLKQHDLAPKNKVHAGTSPGYAKGAVNRRRQ